MSDDSAYQALMLNTSNRVGLLILDALNQVTGTERKAQFSFWMSMAAANVSVGAITAAVLLECGGEASPEAIVAEVLEQMRPTLVNTVGACLAAGVAAAGGLN